MGYLTSSWCLKSAEATGDWNLNREVGWKWSPEISWILTLFDGLPQFLLLQFHDSVHVLIEAELARVSYLLLDIDWGPLHRAVIFNYIYHHKTE